MYPVIADAYVGTVCWSNSQTLQGVSGIFSRLFVFTEDGYIRGESLLTS